MRQAIISGQSFSKSNLDDVIGFDRYAKDIISSHGYEPYGLKSKPDTSLAFNDKERLKSCKQNSACFKAIWYMMLNNKTRYFSLDLSGVPIDGVPIECLDQHHMHPKATVKNSGSAFLTIANLIPLNSEAHRKIIKDDNFESYIKTQREQIGDEGFRSTLKGLLIPTDLSPLENIESRNTTLKPRNDLITDFINNYFK